MRRTKAYSYPSEYHIWQSMKARCTNKNDKFYQDYGGRGITVCERWLNSFENFLEDIGARPSKGLVLDRINNDKGYSPDNCRWATISESAVNTRIRKDNKTGHKGIYFVAHNNKYRAMLYRNNSRKHVGYFVTLSQAIEAYQEAVLLCDMVVPPKKATGSKPSTKRRAKTKPNES